MNVSQKCEYALRAVFELARRRGSGVTTIAEIAAAQAVPVRFLEVILNQLRGAGFVESRRGVHGGYVLVRSAGQISVGDIIRFIDGPIVPIKGASTNDMQPTLRGRCVLLKLWARARDAIAEIYDNTTIQDLVDQDESLASAAVPSYTI